MFDLTIWYLWYALLYTNSYIYRKVHYFFSPCQLEATYNIGSPLLLSCMPKSFFHLRTSGTLFWQGQHWPDQHLSGAVVGTDVFLFWGVFDPQHHTGIFLYVVLLKTGKETRNIDVFCTCELPPRIGICSTLLSTLTEVFLYFFLSCRANARV